jgi:hypothetical protein
LQTKNTGKYRFFEKHGKPEKDEEPGKNEIKKANVCAVSVRMTHHTRGHATSVHDNRDYK